MKDLKYPEDFTNKLICGNSLELIKKIPDEVIDIIITDPPYGLNKKDIYGDSNLTMFYNILNECYRVLKENSFFITFFSIKFLPELFKNNPFNYFWQMILHCPDGNVYSPIGITKYMPCFIFKKGNPNIKNKNIDLIIDTPGKMIEPDEGYIDHPTPKPKKFIKELIEMFTDERQIVFDPFIGSGSTAIACIQTNRKFIGIDINKKYIDIAYSRINKYKDVLNELQNRK